MERRESLCTVGGNVNYAATGENIMKDPLKAKIELSYDPAIPLLGIFPKDRKILTWKDMCSPYLLQHYFQ